jgi:hypothetical protein
LLWPRACRGCVVDLKLIFYRGLEVVYFLRLCLSSCAAGREARWRFFLPSAALSIRYSARTMPWECDLAFEGVDGV